MDKVDKHLKKFGIIPQDADLPKIRIILNQEIEKESKQQGLGDTELMKLCCVELFSKKAKKDIFLIWRAKNSSMDANGSIDIQLLCSNELENTKSYLKSLKSDISKIILSELNISEQNGDFKDFSFEKELEFYKNYYEE